jgi:hypothetical protein
MTAGSQSTKVCSAHRAEKHGVAAWPRARTEPGLIPEDFAAVRADMETGEALEL